MSAYVDHGIAAEAGKKIERARRALRLSARQLARTAGIDFGYLRRVEKGASASTALYVRLAGLVGVSVADLFAEEHGRTVPASRRPRKAKSSAA